MFKKMVLFLALGAAFISSIAQVTYPVERPTLKVGDSWSYQRTDLWKNEVNPNKNSFSVSAINDKGIYRMTGTNLEGKPSNFNNDPDLNGPKYKVQGEDMYQAFSKWPIVDGAVWDFAYKRILGDGTIVSQNYACKLSGAERVKVPAGEFDTIKMACKGFWTNTQGGSGSQEFIRWYAPAVKRHVKQQDKWWFGGTLQGQTLDELVEFKVN
jgi:hypothetical protein